MGGVCGGSGADSRGIIEGDGRVFWVQHWGNHRGGENTGAPPNAPWPKLPRWRLCHRGEPRYETKLPVSVKSIAETP